VIVLKRIAAGVAIAGTLGFAGLGVGPAVANANPGSPGIPWQQDDGGWWGHGHGHWHGDDWRGGRGWGGPGWGGPGWGWGGAGWGGPCASGSIGWASGAVCA
jgi:hypothetical protein